MIQQTTSANTTETAAAAASHQETIRQLQAQLRQQKEYTRSLEEHNRLLTTRNHLMDRHLNHQMLAVVEWDEEFRVKRWTRQATLLFGYEAGTMLGKRPGEWGFLEGEEGQVMENVFRHVALYRRKSCTLKLRALTSEGEQVVTEWHTSVVTDEQGQVISALSFVQDATEIHNYGEQLNENRRRLRMYFDMALEGVLLLENGIVRDANQQIASFFQISPEGLIGRDSLTLTRFKKFITPRANVESPDCRPVKCWCYRDNGTAFFAEIKYRHVLHRDKTYTIVQFRDLTEITRTTQTLQLDNRKFRETFEKVNAGMAHISAGGEFTFINEAMARMHGYCKDELYKLPYIQLAHHEDREKELELFEQLLEGKVQNFTLEKRNYRKNGSVIWVGISVTLVDRLADEPFCMAVVEDITDRKQMETRLSDTSEELDMYIYRAAHDLKGPVASALGLCEVAGLDVQDKNAHQYFQLLQGKMHQLQVVINSLINSSKIKSKTVEKEQVNLNQVVNGITHSLSYIADEDNFEFKLEVPRELCMVTDLYLLRSCLQNIIENAVKYRRSPMQLQGSGERSRVHIQARQEGDSICIAIADNGIGIRQEMIHQVFNMFFRATEASEGTGLGLYMTRNAVAKLGGKITVESEYGQGTVFNLVFPGNIQE